MNPPGALAERSLVSDGTVTLAAADGVRTTAYVARPSRITSKLPGMMVSIHGLGLDDHMRDVTRRFAGLGMLAIAADTFGRVGGPPEIEDRAQIMAKINAMGDLGAIGDLRASVDWLRAQPASNGRVAGIGFCMGGRLLLMVATDGPVLDLAIDCWGGRMTRRTQPDDALHPEAPVERIDRLACPLLGIFGDDDLDPNPDDVAELQAAVKRHGKSMVTRSFPGAGHAFFADTRPSYREVQAHDAWQEFVQFLKPILAPAG
jgi:carboxymethylenebutenolidase